MKTYTFEEYKKKINAPGLRHNQSTLATRRVRWCERGDKQSITCSCLRKAWLFVEWKAFKDCPNCLGYGIMPIPWSELK